MYTLEEIANLLELEKSNFRIKIKETKKGKFEILEKSPYFKIYVELECSKLIKDTVKDYQLRFTKLLSLIDEKNFEDLRVYFNTIDISMKKFSRDLFTMGIALILNAPEIEFYQLQVKDRKKIDKLSKEYIILTHTEFSSHITFYAIKRSDLPRYLKREPEPTFTCVVI